MSTMTIPAPVGSDWGSDVAASITNAAALRQRGKLEGRQLDIAAKQQAATEKYQGEDIAIKREALTEEGVQKDKDRVARKAEELMRAAANIRAQELMIKGNKELQGSMQEFTRNAQVAKERGDDAQAAENRARAAAIKQEMDWNEANPEAYARIRTSSADAADARRESTNLLAQVRIAEMERALGRLNEAQLNNNYNRLKDLSTSIGGTDPYDAKAIQAGATAIESGAGHEGAMAAAAPYLRYKQIAAMARDPKSLMSAGTRGRVTQISISGGDMKDIRAVPVSSSWWNSAREYLGLGKFDPKSADVFLMDEVDAKAAGEKALAAYNSAEPILKPGSAPAGSAPAGSATKADVKSVLGGRKVK